MMSRTFKLVRLTCALLLLVFGSAAFAQDHPGIDQFNQAAEQFDRLVSEAKVSGTLPRMSDPVAGALLRRLTDARRTFGGQDFAPADYPMISGILKRTLDWWSLYTRFGIEGLSQEEAGAKARRNEVEFQDEMMPLMTACLEDMAQVMILVEKEFVRRGGIERVSEPDRRSLENLRQGNVQVIEDMLKVIAAAETRPAHKAEAVDALARNAATYASQLNSAQRAGLAAKVAAVRPDLPAPVQAQLDRVVAALSVTTCERLCLL
jgi:hypothetical protein